MPTFTSALGRHWPLLGLSRTFHPTDSPRKPEGLEQHQNNNKNASTVLLLFAKHKTKYF
jgi:hypothetical protein